jgi:hypothetical protein
MCRWLECADVQMEGDVRMIGCEDVQMEGDVRMIKCADVRMSGELQILTFKFKQLCKVLTFNF